MGKKPLKTNVLRGALNKKQEARMKNRHFKGITGVLLLAVCGIYAGCVSFIEPRKMDLAAENTSGQILNLKFAGDPSGDYTAQAEKLVKSGFLNTQGEEYGYYDIRFEIITRDYSPAITSLYYVPAFLVLPLLGVPTAGENFTIAAHFYIFDSRGNIVKHYANSATFKVWVGLYYGGNSTKKGTAKFSALFDGIFDQAALESSEINQTLLDAGPVSGNAGMELVQANIDQYFKAGK
jgi:hypothetical protein